MTQTPFQPLVQTMQPNPLCDYCPPTARRAAHMALQAVEPGPNQTSAVIHQRCICTLCHIRLLDAVLRPQVAVRLAADETEAALRDLRNCVAQLQAELRDVRNGGRS